MKRSVCAKEQAARISGVTTRDSGEGTSRLSAVVYVYSLLRALADFETPTSCSCCYLHRYWG